MKAAVARPRARSARPAILPPRQRSGAHNAHARRLAFQKLPDPCVTVRSGADQGGPARLTRAHSDRHSPGGEISGVKMPIAFQFVTAFVFGAALVILALQIILGVSPLVRN